MAKAVYNLYELVPRRRRPFEERDDGKVEVLLPRYGDGRIGRLLGSFLSREPVRICLDDVGTCVWQLCDGRRSVRAIGEALREEFGQKVEPVYDRLGEFLDRMSKGGLIEWRQ